jgi:endonuclease YncB( thermonuclease family)
VLLVILLVVWAGFDPALVYPPEFLSGPAERVTDHFTRCGRGRGAPESSTATRERKIRVIGIDAPEVHARCPKEARLAE